MRPGPGRGQATVEFALVLPLVLALVLVTVDVAVIAREAVLVQHAARQAARVAAIEGDPAAAQNAALAVAGRTAAVEVVLAPPGGTVVATVRLRLADRLALLGRLRPDLSVTATVRLRREGDPDDR